MNDITREGLPERLRALADDEINGISAVLSPGNSHDLLTAADEIEVLRGYRDAAESDAAIARLLVDRYRMTDDERKAIEYYIGTGGPSGVDGTLRGLLDRTATLPTPNGHAPRGSGSQPVGVAGCAHGNQPTAEQVRLFTERLLAMGGVPGRFSP